MTDKDIRCALLRSLEAADPAAVLREEFPLQRGNGRADCVAINGVITGFEIKSDKDSLGRLPQQVRLYESVFDYCFLVAAPKHLLAAMKIVPQGWGIRVATFDNNSTSIHNVRRAQRNRSTDFADLIRLLWKPEVVRLLKSLGEPVNGSSPIRQLWGALAAYPKAKVTRLVIDALKVRDSWPVGAVHGVVPVERDRGLDFKQPG